MDTNDHVGTDLSPPDGRETAPPEPTPAELAYVEDVALYFEQTGLQRMEGRIIGWLLICDPPEQSAADLARVLHASKGSISTGTRHLVQAKLIERVSLPGHRRDYFRIRDDGWAERMRDATATITALTRLTARGLALLGPDDAERRQRLEAMHALYTWIGREYPKLFARWEEERGTTLRR